MPGRFELTPYGAKVGTVELSHAHLKHICESGERNVCVGEIARAFRKRFGFPINRSVIAKTLKEYRRADLAQYGAAPHPVISRSTGQAMLFPGHRGPDGRVDWDQVPGYVDEAAEVRKAAREFVK